jgi:quercetin dioxygenase-like cupin family protein
MEVFMKTTTPTQAEIENGLARFSELKSTEHYFRQLVPGELADAVLPVAMPQQLYGVLGPASADSDVMPYGGRSPEGFVAMLAECEPGIGPPLHAHQLTYEIFFVTKGRFRVEWGDEGEHAVELGEFDTLCIPPGCNRRFENISDERGFLFAIAYGHEKVIADAASPPSVREEILATAPEVVDGIPTAEWLERLGFRYNAGVDDGQL